MTPRKRLFIAFVSWMLLGLVVLSYKGPYAWSKAFFKLWSLYSLAAGIWVLMPLLKILNAAMEKEKARGSTHSDEG